VLLAVFTLLLIVLKLIPRNRFLSSNIILAFYDHLPITLSRKFFLPPLCLALIKKLFSVSIILFSSFTCSRLHFTTYYRCQPTNNVWE
jgi:hypothetical protein